MTIMDRVKELVKALTGGYDTEFDDEAYSIKELEELNRMSQANISAMEEKHGKPTMHIEGEKDRLGINKPTMQVKVQEEPKIYAQPKREDYDLDR